MLQEIKQFYEFGEFRIDVTKRRLLRAGEIVPLTPKAFDVLLVLAEQSGRMIEKDELMRKVWPDTAVEENNLTQNIYTLRKVFGERRNESRYIATVPGLGYRFVAEVKRVPFEDGEVTIQEKREARVVITETESENDGEALTHPALPASVTPPLLPAATEPRRINKQVAGGLIALAIVLATVMTYAFIRYWRATPSAEGFRELTVNQLSHTGTTTRATISPDGKYVAYSISEGDRQSLWLRQLATGSTQQIVPPEDASYFTLNYSHDGNYLYFVKGKQGDPERVLYKMPALGGIPVKVASGMDAFISLSPDDQQITFIRYSISESALIVVNADGSGERQLATRPMTDFFKVPSWSPDGKMIACSTGSGEAYDMQNSVVGVSLEDGSQKTLTNKKWFWTRWVEWLSDGSGLLLTATEDDAQPAQIWHISYPQGEVRQVTNDTKHYHSLSLSADSKTMVATQTQLLSEIWVASLGDGSAPKKLTFGSGNYGDVCFTSDGRILFSSQESGNTDIWRMNADGTEKQRLTSEISVDTHQTDSPDGRYIFFASNRAGAFNIWRMDSDGSHPVRLTTGNGEKFPYCSPDGKWVIYDTVAPIENRYSLWKVSIDGGQPVRLADHAYRATVSPDGKHIAYFAVDTTYKIVVIPFAGGAAEKIFDLPPDVSPLVDVHWSADSQALLYPVVWRGVTDLWMQPLDGSSSKQVTDLKLEGRFIFDLSPDSKRFVFARRLWTFDMLLLTNFR